MNQSDGITGSIASWPFLPSSTLDVQGWSFWLSLIGLALTLVGFAITWKQLIKTQEAASAVRKEVVRIQLSVQSYDAAHHVSRAASALEATKRHLRNAAWPDVADSYEDFRRAVITLQQLELPELKRFDDDINEASRYIIRLCERIENQMSKSSVSIDSAKTVSMLRHHGELTGSLDNALQKGLVT